MNRKKGQHSPKQSRRHRPAHGCSTCARATCMPPRTGSVPHASCPRTGSASSPHAHTQVRHTRPPALARARCTVKKKKVASVPYEHVEPLPALHGRPAMPLHRSPENTAPAAPPILARGAPPPLRPRWSRTPDALRPTQPRCHLVAVPPAYSRPPVAHTRAIDLAASSLLCRP